MSVTIIHPTAIVSEKARIGTNVKIGPFSIVDDDVEIGDNTVIRSNVVLSDGARIGSNCELFPGAVIATEPQDLKFTGEPTLAIVGDRTVIREYATIHRGTGESKRTVVGSDCLIMAYSHVAHDCIIGDSVIISNTTQMAGHVEIEDNVNIGGVVKIHQFCRIGRYAFIGADVKIVKDVPPYTLIGRQPAKVEGINKIGLRRKGFSNEKINEIEKFYDTILFSSLNNRDGIKKYKEENEISEEISHCIRFIEDSKRGIHR